MKKIAIIGAGITGITTAYQLIKRGYDVTVFEKHRYPGMETSFANGGQLSASNAEVWTSWNTVGQAIKWIFKKDAPLLFNPRPTLHKLTWVLEFLANIPNHKKNTLYTAKMAIESRKEFKKILKEENLKINLEEDVMGDRRFAAVTPTPSPLANGVRNVSNHHFPGMTLKSPFDFLPRATRMNLNCF